MTLKVVWGITGSGDKMPETVAAMAALPERLDLEITAAVSIAGERVLRWYKLRETVDEIAKSVKIEKDANSPFITGPLRSVSTIACWWRLRPRTRSPRSCTASRTAC